MRAVRGEETSQDNAEAALGMASGFRASQNTRAEGAGHDSCRQIVNAFKEFWGPGHPLKIHEERSQAFRIILYSWKHRQDIDVTGLVHQDLLTEDGLCAGPNKTAILRLLTAAFHGEKEFIREAVQLEAAMTDANP